VWNAWVTQVPPMAFQKKLELEQKSQLFLNQMESIPQEFKEVLNELTIKFFGNLQLFNYLEPNFHDQRKQTSENYFQNYNCVAVWSKAGKFYEAPYGWYGIDVKVDAQIQEAVFQDWHVCYHCTSDAAVASVLVHHSMALPGDTLLDGTVLKIPEGHIHGKNYIFGSPCLSYCVYGYGNICQFQKYKIMFVLQLRMKPGSYFEQKDTLNYPLNVYHISFSNDKIEWVNSSRDTVIVTRIWMKLQ